ncbi:MAG: hypothetical protein ABI304_07845 [Rudaea sp.]
MGAGSFFAELKRRNVLRAAAVYAAAVWAFGQGLSQFSPALGLPDWTTRWFLVAAIIGFPIWLAFAWFYEFTPQGLKRESEIAPSESITAHTGRKLDFWIIGILAVAVVLLVTDRFVVHKGSAAIAEKSIAVLPLANESGDKDQQYFSDGLSEDFINALSQFDGLKVIGRNSAFQFRNSKDDAQTIGAKLRVAHLLEGSVRREGDTVRISAALTNTKDASTLWSQHYDRPYKDLFALQDEITNAVTSALKATLLEGNGAVVQSDRPPGGNLDAYSAYLRGNFADRINTKAGDLQAIDFFNEAIRLDPRYAQAYAALSFAWTAHAAQYLTGIPMQRAYAKSREAASIALSLRPDLASAHQALAYLLQTADFNWAAADAEFRRAAQLDPNSGRHMWGVLLATMGKTEPAVQLTEAALASDPLSATGYNWLAQFLGALGRLDAAKTAIGKAIELQPQAEGQHETLAIIEIQRGDAQAALGTAQQESPGVWQDAALALARQIGGDRAAADAALKSLVERQAENATYQIAQVYALRGDPDKMFEWLDRAWTNHDPGISSLLYDPFILRYQHDPRFAAFCHKVGLPTTTNAKAMP